MLDIIGNSDAHYEGIFWIKCKNCGEETRNEWVDDPLVLRFNSSCIRCGESGEFRLNRPKWTELPTWPRPSK